MSIFAIANFHRGENVENRDIRHSHHSSKFFQKSTAKVVMTSLTYYVKISLTISITVYLEMNLFSSMNVNSNVLQIFQLLQQYNDRNLAFQFQLDDVE
jgi:hypothetical protein